MIRILNTIKVFAFWGIIFLLLLVFGLDDRDLAFILGKIKKIKKQRLS